MSSFPAVTTIPTTLPTSRSLLPFGSSPLVYYFKAGDSLPVFVFHVSVKELPSPAAALHLNLPATICPSENQLNLI